MTDARTYGLTTRAVELLAVLRAFRAQHGRVPTYEEMAADLGVAAKSTVHRLITQLEARGLVRRLHCKRQSVELIEPRTITLPEDVAVSLRHAARAAGRTPEEHVAALVRHNCPSPSPF
jgi:SOS-response transcriptional repressor LexA